MINLFEYGSTNDVDVLVTNIEKATASNGNEYQKLTIRDTDGFTCVVHSFDIILQNTGIIKMTIDTREYNGKKSYILKHVANSESSEEDFEPKASFDVEATRKNLIKEMWELPKALGKIVSVVFGEVTVNSFCSVPFSENAYNKPSGLLLATTRMINIAKSVAGTIPGVDEKLLVAACMLYHVGVTRLNKATSVFVGERLQTIALVTSAISQLKTDRELKEEDEEVVQMLLNIICAAYGTPTEDVIPEAMLLRHISYMVRKSDEINSVIAFSEEGTLTAGNSDYKMPKYYKRHEVNTEPAEEDVSSEPA